MGPGRTASSQECSVAQQMGYLIAKAGYVLLTGGVAHGVMDSASLGAKEAGGLTIGVLPYKQPSDTHPVSKSVDIPIITHFGEGRNVINVMSCDIVVVIGMCPGTATEACHAVKNGKPVILLGNDETTLNFLKDVLKGNVQTADSPEDAIKLIEELLE